MEPLRKALRLPRVNLFIADDTGLGKTIEAGLIARELLLRRKAKAHRRVGAAVDAGAVEGGAGRAMATAPSSGPT
jgi:SNF2 family DNA or RNA helicase